MKFEFLALKWAMTETLRLYLLGHKCIVYTDNNLSSTKLGATKQRWTAQVAAFDFELKYRSGRSNRNADALSRQQPLGPLDLKAMLPGTVVPSALQQVLASQSFGATQASIPILPQHSTSVSTLCPTTG